MDFSTRKIKRFNLLTDVYNHYFESQGDAFKVENADFETISAFQILMDKGFIEKTVGVGYQLQNFEVKITDARLKSRHRLL